MKQLSNEYSPTQLRVLRILARYERTGGHGERQLAGKNAAPLLSAARALVRKGLAWTYRTGSYGLTDKGREVAAKALAEYEKDSPQ